MAGRKSDGGGFSGRIELVGADARAERPAVAVHALAADGTVVATANVGADGRFELPPGALDKAARVAIADASADATLEGQPTLAYRVDEVQTLFKGDVLALPESAWGPLFGYRVCVSGTARRCYPWRPILEYLQATTAASALASLSSSRASALVDISKIDPEYVFLPYRCGIVCQGVIEVYRRTCCCQPPIYIDPGDIVDGPVDWPKPWPPPGDPPFTPPGGDPGPFPVPPGPGPDPAPFELLESVSTGGALDARKLNAERDAFAMRSLSGDRLAEYIKLRPYLWCTCGTGTKVAEGLVADDGTWSACWWDFPRFLLPNCSEEYAYRIKQVIDGLEVTIYDGPAAGQWFAAGAHPTLTSYSRSAVACGGDPVVPGSGPATVLLHSIGSTESWQLGTPDQDSPDSVGSLQPNSGLLNPAAGDGPGVNLPLGGALGLRYFFSRGLQPIATYFRVDVAAANAAGDPISGWAPVAVPAWNSWKYVSGTGFVRAQHSLGPDANGLYQIPYESGGPLAAFEQWDQDQYHAILDSTLQNDGKYLVRVQVFDAGGNQIKPTGSTGSGANAAFTFGRWRVPAGPPDNVPYSALTHVLWWDNNHAVSAIEGVRLSTATGSPVCQFLDGSSTDGVTIDYRAYHPHPTSGGSPSFLQGYSLSVVKGINGGTPFSTGAFAEPGKPPAGAAARRRERSAASWAPTRGARSP